MKTPLNKTEKGGALGIHKVLVPLDFSEYSKKALAYAVAFARQFGAKLTLINVIEPRVYPVDTVIVPAAMEDSTTIAVDAARESMRSIRNSIDLPAGMVEEPLVVVGRPWVEITHEAARLGTDLIIMATHGYTGLKHVYLGSVTERVVRHAPCPVLVVREHEREFVELAKVA
jgi:nucleotide-binding universal stress UspA family protein